jgi:acetolactate synthase-1/2/3 large subunit
MVCVPFVHEVGAAIATEYFNAATDPGAGKAFALVTAGPGITNAMTGVAGAWQESRELLIIGGQVKSSDLSRGELRQRGIQEIDGVRLVESVVKRAVLIERPLPRETVIAAVREGAAPRKGPVFLEICLDAQAAAPLSEGSATINVVQPTLQRVGLDDIEAVTTLLSAASRPVLLIGGGVSRDTLRDLDDAVTAAGIPLMTTWNGADRVPTEHPLYSGRPNTWGQRAANVLIQQADLVIAVGTRLGLQQTGFAWEQFIPVGRVVQVDVDGSELRKGHPRVHLPLQGDADGFLQDLFAAVEPAHGRWGQWLEFISDVRAALPLNDPENQTRPGFVKPYEFAMELCDAAGSEDILMPCSSGGAATVSMQALRLRSRQKLVGDKSLASMGYGLSGAIGAALANPTRTVFLTEGDGGFSQNVQELGTLAANGLRVKIFLLANNGYASIRMTQQNYFDGAWIGCDASTGLGLPDWELLAKAYGVPFARMSASDALDGEEVRALLHNDGPALIEVPIDPEQTYYPKIMSAVQPDGSMSSNPLHLMSPQLDEALAERVMPYLAGQTERVGAVG